MRKISILPSIITLGNLTCGFASIVLSAEAEGESDPAKFVMAAWLILLAMVFDALDGQVARLTKTAGDFGVQLDSLCDAVTFGLAPGVLINRLSIYYGRPPMESIAWLFPIVYAICAILRLARFNMETGIEEEDHEAFRGLPSPAAAGQVATLIILDESLGAHRPLVGIMPFIGLGAGLLMVSRVPYVHMGNRLFKGQRPYTHLVTLIVLCIFMAFSYKLALACLFTSYVVFGLLMAAFWPQQRETEQPTTA